MSSIVNHWKHINEISGRFEVKENYMLPYEEFLRLCEELFGSSEAKENEARIHNIFDAFDLNRDGSLNAEEWKRCHEKWLRVLLEAINVLLIVDVQNDFIDGSLALKGCGCGQDGKDVVTPINRLLSSRRWRKVIYSLDWHPENHISFYENLHMRKLHPDSKVSKETAKPFDEVIFFEPHIKQKLWPRHCVMYTWGAELHKDLLVLPDSVKVRKGQNPNMDSYSAFFDNNADGSTELESVLVELGATDLYICGLAYDACVRATCLDALQLGYRVAVIDDCCRGINSNDITHTKCLISDRGGYITDSESVLSVIDEGKQSLIVAEQIVKALKIDTNGTAGKEKNHQREGK